MLDEQGKFKEANFADLRSKAFGLTDGGAAPPAGARNESGPESTSAPGGGGSGGRDGGGRGGRGEAGFASPCQSRLAGFASREGKFHRWCGAAGGVACSEAAVTAELGPCCRRRAVTVRPGLLRDCQGAQTLASHGKVTSSPAKRCQLAQGYKNADGDSPPYAAQGDGEAAAAGAAAAAAATVAAAAARATGTWARTSTRSCASSRTSTSSPLSCSASAASARCRALPCLPYLSPPATRHPFHLQFSPHNLDAH